MPNAASNERAHPTAGAAGPEPGAGWDHAALLRALHRELRDRDLADAVAALRRRAPRPGHETQLLAWARHVAAELAADPDASDFDAFAAARAERLAAERLLEHYSPERLASERAQREFVLPDRAPLPSLPSPARDRAGALALPPRAAVTREPTRGDAS